MKRLLLLCPLLFALFSGDVSAQTEQVVISRHASVYPAMSRDARPIVALASGVVITIVKRYPDWVLVRYSRGGEGYIEARDLPSPATTLRGPCADSLYQVLRQKDINSLSEREWAYMQERDRACAVYQQKEVQPTSPALQRPSDADMRQVPPEAPKRSADSTLRDGFWFNAGLGYGSLGCLDCSSRVGGFSGGLAVGSTLSQKFLFAIATNGWSKSDGGATVIAGSLTAALRFYPSSHGNFFLLGGLGIGSVDVALSGYGSANAIGTSALLGLGYDIRVAPMTSLTPFWNGIGIANDSGDLNFGQIGLGITFH